MTGVLERTRTIAGDDVISNLNTGDTLTHALHNACGLMAQDTGEQALWVTPVVNMQPNSIQSD